MSGIGIGMVGGWPGDGDPRRCSFCGRREDAVEHLVRARGGLYICERCVAQAHEAIDSAPPGQRLVRIRPAPAGVMNRDGAEQAIEQAFETVFGTQPIADKCRAIERGDNLGPVMEEVLARYAPAQQMDVSVDYVRFVSENEAEVHFVLFPGPFGRGGLNQAGHAVLVDGQWKMSRDTYCRLVRMIGIQCPPPED